MKKVPLHKYEVGIARAKSNRRHVLNAKTGETLCGIKKHPADWYGYYVHPNAIWGEINCPKCIKVGKLI